MRIGSNPHRDQPHEQSQYLHQIVIPIYIPNLEGYFKDSFRIFKLCLDSLFSTIHDKTFITIVNNGSGAFIKEYLDKLLQENKIHELIHTHNIGKINAVLKGLVGNDIELVTISDADVLFLPNWQKETAKIFACVPRAGVVGLVPQFKTYESYCGNVLFDNLFNNKLKFLPVKNQTDLKRFYDSIGWTWNYNTDYLKFNLGLEVNSDLTVLIGSGHFVATYKKDVFEEVKTYFGYKLGGTSERYLDRAPLKKGYWRLTTYDNFAYHMGNIFEDWMGDLSFNGSDQQFAYSNFSKNKTLSNFNYFFKNRIFIKFISVKWLVKLFIRWKKLPKEMIDNY